MLLKHPMAPELLERDCANISRYFRRLGVDTDAERV
jgi:serine/threonine-protein kinase RIO1